MKHPVLFSFLFLLLNVRVFGQPANKALLQLESSPALMNVTPGGQISIATRTGQFASATSIYEPWESKYIVRKDSFGLNIGFTLENVDFFNKDTGFVSGFIEHHGKYNIIYRTTDGGKNWQPVDFGMDGWVDIATHLDNGEAWLSVSGGGIAYTKDYGAHWQSFAIPEKKQRFHTMFFDNTRQGIIGSLWNLVAVTSDNCGNWSILPTPLDQKKYNKTNVGSRPSIDKVVSFKNYYLIKQEGMVFYSAKSHIDWVPLTQVKDFFTDPGNTALFFCTKKSSIARAGDNIQIATPFDSVSAGYPSFVKNGSLYMISSEKMVCIQPDNSMSTASMYSNSQRTSEPLVVGYSRAGARYGATGNQIFRQDTVDGKWQHVFDLPFSTEGGTLALTDDTTILFAKDDSLRYYHIHTRKTTATTLAIKKKNFVDAGIRQLIFEKGSQGCFHYFADKVVYNRGDENFETSGLEQPSTKHYSDIKSDEHPINARLVDTFVQNLLQDPFPILSLADLAITTSAFEQCKKDIVDCRESIEHHRKQRKDNAFQLYENNIRFDTLLSMVDSIQHILGPILTQYMSNLSDGMWSTTSNWVRVTMVNNNDEKLVVESIFYEPAPFYFPWRIRLDGVSSMAPDIRINRFLQAAYPGFVEKGNSLKILHHLVKQLYKDQLQ